MRWGFANISIPNNHCEHIERRSSLFSVDHVHNHNDGSCSKSNPRPGLPPGAHLPSPRPGNAHGQNKSQAAQQHDSHRAYPDVPSFPGLRLDTHTHHSLALHHRGRHSSTINANGIIYTIPCPAEAIRPRGFRSTTIRTCCAAVPPGDYCGQDLLGHCPSIDAVVEVGFHVMGFDLGSCRGWGGAYCLGTGGACGIWRILSHHDTRLGRLQRMESVQSSLCRDVSQAQLIGGGRSSRQSFHIGVP
ncbi:uncharacterized protein BCR38DRAFT_439379 [Pseudomassariella vexata]|uniref:Uncharacterized protein n=1 Tax=Pseudomassariella vexata TaxID=1141098 RepID=A0A1Y2DU01_9PEZI|nr:uncharacterized protein BCR38DRAFT_439379 [Pseudomassariella vexata]ORY62649.1 hypothetical protein BCR38DRAFT_439379 [Pseudomassariella vexata]